MSENGERRDSGVGSFVGWGLLGIGWMGLSWIVSTFLER